VPGPRRDAFEAPREWVGARVVLQDEPSAAAESVLETDPILAAHDALRAALERRLDEAERAFLAKG